MRLPILTASLALLAVAALALAVGLPLGGDSEPRAQTVLRDDFESGRLDKWPILQRVSSDRISVVPNPIGAGRAARFEVRRDDRVGNDVDARAEIAWDDVMAWPGDTFEYEWRMLLPPSYPLDRRWQVVAQWKNEGPGTPPLQLGLRGRCLGITAGPQAGSRMLWSAPIERGRWVDFEARITFSTDARSGAVDARLDGRDVLRDFRLQTLYRGVPSYLKLGLYRSGDIDRRGIVYFDDVTVVTSPSIRREGRGERYSAGRC